MRPIGGRGNTSLTCCFSPASHLYIQALLGKLTTFPTTPLEASVAALFRDQSWGGVALLPQLTDGVCKMGSGDALPTAACSKRNLYFKVLTDPPFSNANNSGLG